MRVDELQQEIDELAIKLKQTIDKMMPAQQQMHEARVAALKQASMSTRYEIYIRPQTHPFFQKNRSSQSGHSCSE